MTYIARLELPSGVVHELVLVDSPSQVYRTPVPLPFSGYSAGDALPAPSMAVKEWQWTGQHSDGKVTAEFWVRHFVAPFPGDMDRSRYEVPVTWLRFSVHEPPPAQRSFLVRVQHELDAQDPYLSGDDGVIDVEVKAENEEAAIRSIRAEYPAVSWDAWVETGNDRPDPAPPPHG